MTQNPLPEDVYLTQFLDSMALEFALRTGKIDAIAAGDGAGSDILTALLQSAGVMDGQGLSHSFAQVLATRRGILEQKLQFLRMVATDITLGLDDLLGDLPSFMAKSQTFSFFDYENARRTRPSDIAATRPWVAYVTALSQAEAPVLAPVLPLDGVARLLEVGGNTGVMAKAALAAHPGLEAVVFDLPGVCAIANETPAERLSFVPGDARSDAWPLVAEQAPDAILFKSVLHDWPVEETQHMLAQAVQHLAPGGRLIVCERGLLTGAEMPFSMTANVVFAPFYRDPSFYLDAFETLGLGDISRVEVPLDMAFHIVSGVRQ